MFKMEIKCKKAQLKNCNKESEHIQPISRYLFWAGMSRLKCANRSLKKV